MFGRLHPRKLPCLKKTERARDLVSLSSQRIVGQRFAYEAIILTRDLYRGLWRRGLVPKGQARLPTLPNKNAESHIGDRPRTKEDAVSGASAASFFYLKSRPLVQMRCIVIRKRTKFWTRQILESVGYKIVEARVHVLANKARRDLPDLGNNTKPKA